MILIDEVIDHISHLLTVVFLYHTRTNGSSRHTQCVHCKSSESPNYDHIRSLLRSHYLTTLDARILASMAQPSRPYDSSHLRNDVNRTSRFTNPMRSPRISNLPPSRRSNLWTIRRHLPRNRNRIFI